MNDRHDDPLDRSIRSALGDIIADSPTPSRLPVSPYEQRRTPAPVRSRRPMLVAAAVVAVAGVVGTVAIANRSSGPTTVAPADTVTDSTPSQEGVTPIATVSTSSPGPDETSSTTARLLYPVLAKVKVGGDLVPAIVNATVVGTDAAWIARATAFVTPASHVVSVQAQGRRFDAVPKGTLQRTVGDNVFYLVNEEGNHAYIATGTCRSVAVLPGDETSNGVLPANELPKSEPWSSEALELMATVDLASPDRWVTTPNGWTEIEGGAAELVYDASFTVQNPERNGNNTRGHLRQAFAPLGFLIGSSVGMATAEQITMKGLPEGTSDQAWLLTNTDGLKYLGWNTTFGSALLYLEGDDPFPGGKFPGIVLEAGHGDQWAAALQQTVAASTGSLRIAATSTTITEGDVTTSYPEGNVDTTVQVNDAGDVITPTTSSIVTGTADKACGPTENG